MNRRAFQMYLAAGLVALPGCQTAVPDPRDMRVANLDDKRQTVTIVVSQPAESTDPVLRETFSIEPQETRLTRAAFPRPGKYRVSAELASGGESTTEWEIDSRDLRVEITPTGEFTFESEPKT